MRTRKWIRVAIHLINWGERFPFFSRRNSLNQHNKITGTKIKQWFTSSRKTRQMRSSDLFTCNCKITPKRTTLMTRVVVVNCLPSHRGSRWRLPYRGEVMGRRRIWHQDRWSNYSNSLRENKIIRWKWVVLVLRLLLTRVILIHRRIIGLKEDQWGRPCIRLTNFSRA